MRVNKNHAQMVLVENAMRGKRVELVSGDRLRSSSGSDILGNKSRDAAVKSHSSLNSGS